jgi:glycerophosphoryl diester phosphodiesterase
VNRHDERPARPPHLTRPQVVAHRGASQTEPEHTLAAFRRALELGVDALECDVRLTADGYLVCVHDRKVDRTSNGSGLVSTLELTHLEGLDWGSWRQLTSGQPAAGAEEPDVEEPGERSRLMTLRRLLKLVADAGPGVELAIETKHPNRYGGLVERRLVETLDCFGWARPAPDRPSPVRVMSFSFLALRRIRQLAPQLPLVFLADRMPAIRRDGSLPRGVDAVGIGVGLLRAHPDLPRRLHQRGYAVHVWTVDDPGDVRRCLDAGVEVIITNRPQQVLRQLGRSAAAGNDGPRGDPSVDDRSGR